MLVQHDIQAKDTLTMYDVVGMRGTYKLCTSSKYLLWYARINVFPSKVSKSYFSSLTLVSPGFCGLVFCMSGDLRGVWSD